MDTSNNLYSEDDEFTVPETQESPSTFSKNIIRRLGIRRTSSGTDAADPNSNTKKYWNSIITYYIVITNNIATHNIILSVQF